MAQDLDAILARQGDLLKANVARCMQLLQQAQTSGVGIGKATDDLSKARKALAKITAENVETPAAGNRFATLESASRWLIDSGYLVSKRSAENHIKEQVALQPDGTRLQEHVAHLAERMRLDGRWQNPTIAAKDAATPEAENSDKALLLKAQRELAEMKVAQQRGNLLDATEEEARDASVLLYIRRHLELGVAERQKAQINGLAGMVPDEIRTVMLQRLPEWIELENARIAEAFDLVAQAGV